MRRYDPERAPDSAAWLALDEQERHRLAAEAHENAPDWHPQAQAKRAHAIYHVIVENQAAEGDPPEVGGTLARLLEEGLGRHDAVHAVASVLAAETWAMLKEKRSFDQTAYLEGLRVLSAETWRR